VGSVGERVVAAYYQDQGETVDSWHADFVDLQVGQRLIDVKKARRLNHTYAGKRPKPYSGKRWRKDVEYLALVIYQNSIVLGDDKQSVTGWTWNQHPWCDIVDNPSSGSVTLPRDRAQIPAL
jgi:hypothetical protein